MAAPATVTTQDISGIWVLDNSSTGKTTNVQTDEILSEQGVGWVTRKVIGNATITLNIKDYDEDGVEVIHIDSTLTGGITASPEHRVFNYTVHEPQDNKLFKKVCGKSKRMTKEEVREHYPVAADWLLDGWAEESFEHRGGIILSESWSHTPDTKADWGVVQTWGFQDVEGERRYVRHVYFQAHRPTEGVGKSDDKKTVGKIIKAKMVYHYKGPLEN